MVAERRVDATMAQSSQLVDLDTKSQIKLFTFSGKDEDWMIWRLKFTAYCALLGWEPAMNEALNQPTEIPYGTLNANALQVTNQLGWLRANNQSAGWILSSNQPAGWLFASNW